MSPKNFIKSKIDDLVELLPHLRVRYEFDALDNSHLIEVMPYEDYRYGQQYINFERSFLQSFIEQFPYENLIFVSEGSLCEVKNPIYEVKGNLYELQSDFN